MSWIGGDPCRPKRVAAGRKAERRPALDHRLDHAAGQRALGQPLFGPVHALKQRLPLVLEPARLKLLVEGLGRPVVRRDSRAAAPPFSWSLSHPPRAAAERRPSLPSL